MVPDTQVTVNSQPAQIFLTLFDLPQSLRGDRQAVQHPAGKAGCRRRIPHWNVQLLGSLTHLLFGPTEIQQRRPNLMLGAGSRARAMLSCVVGVGAVDDGIEGPFRL
jgi:hypothetical protein